MEKVGLVLDSTTYLSDDILKADHVRVVPLNVIEGEQTYKETEITPAFVYDQLDKGKKLSTSQPSPEAFTEAYESLIKDGYEKIAVITISKGLSGTYQSALLGKEAIDDPEKVYVIDTENAGFGNELVTLEFLKYLETLDSFDALISKTEAIAGKTDLIFTVENLFSLQKGGRLSRRKAFLGTVLRIKPIIRMIDGELKLVHKERTIKKLVDYVVSRIEEQKDRNATLYVRMVHQKSQDLVQRVSDRLNQTFNNVKIAVNPYIGPVFSIHIGKKGFGISWYSEA